MAHDALLNADQVTAILKEANGGRRGFSRRTVVRMAERGDLPYVQRIPFGPRGAYVFDRTVVELYAARMQLAMKAEAQEEEAAAS